MNHRLEAKKDEILSEILRDICICESCAEDVNGKLGTYKQIAAEHEWALETIKMFETSSKECKSLHGLSGFVELNDKVQEVGGNLQEFKLELEDAAVEVRNLIDEQNKHIAFLRDARYTVEDATDIEELENMDLPWNHWMWATPDLKLDRVAKQWESMNAQNRLMEFLLKQRTLINEVNEKTPRPEEESEK